MIIFPAPVSMGAPPLIECCGDLGRSAFLYLRRMIGYAVKMDSLLVELHTRRLESGGLEIVSGYYQDRQVIRASSESTVDFDVTWVKWHLLRFMGYPANAELPVIGSINIDFQGNAKEVYVYLCSGLKEIRTTPEFALSFTSEPKTKSWWDETFDLAPILRAKKMIPEYRSALRGACFVPPWEGKVVGVDAYPWPDRIQLAGWK